MARITLIDAVLWADNLFNQYDVPAGEQATLYRLIHAVNANRWHPAAISVNQLSAKLNADKRTTKKWVDSLIERGWIKRDAEEKFSVNVKNETAKNDEVIINGNEKSHKPSAVPARDREPAREVQTAPYIRPEARILSMVQKLES